MAPSKESRTRPAGFTLIELLVVVAIITVLIAILLPSLVNARNTAKQVACLSNARQLGIISTMWASDNTNWTPPGTWRVKFADGYGFNETKLRCPSVRGEPEGAGGGFGSNLGYGLNANLINPISFMTPYWGGTGSPWYDKNGRIKIQQAALPADVILYMDSTTYYGGYWQNYTFAYTLYAYNRHTIRTMQGANIVFLDGHAEFKDRNWIEEPSSSPVNNIGSSGVAIGWGGKRFKVW